jgi:predicted MFS family arabinose efflux permease
MNKKANVAAGEWRAHWPLALSATAGMSLGSVAVYSLGLFMAPLQQAFGWSRAEVSSGMLVFAVIGTVFSTFAGAIVDRWGTRRLAVFGVVLASFAIMAFALATPSIAVWWGLWALFSLANMAVSPVIWTAAVSSVFKIGRGLALATTLCGVAISALVGPALSRWAIDGYGWRAAFVVLGLGWGGAVFVPVALFFHDARARRRRSMSNSELKLDTAAEAVALAELPGLEFREILRRPVFWKLFISQIIFITLVTAMLIHMIPILTGKGLSRTAAAYVLGAYGLASIVGKLSSGWVLDRVQGPYVGAGMVATMAMSCVVLQLGGQSVLAATIAVAILGLAAGGNLACGSYMTTRYVGLRAYGKAYGVITGSSSLAAGVGPWIGGLVYDHYHGYGVLLTATIPLTLLCGLLIASLGRYPQWPSAPGLTAAE